MEFPIKLPGWLVEVIDNSNSEGINVEDFQSFLNGKSKIKVCLEGLPGGGKSTILDHFKSNKKITCLNQFEREVVGSSGNQIQYYKNDVYKSLLADRSDKRTVLMDRDFFSTLAYTYAYSKIYKCNSYEILNEYYSFLIGTELKLADVYIYLKVPISLSIKRKRRNVNDGEIWSQPKFIKLMSEYYEALFKLIKHISFVIEVDTSEKSVGETELIIDTLLKNYA